MKKNKKGEKKNKFQKSFYFEDYADLENEIINKNGKITIDI